MKNNVTRVFVLLVMVWVMASCGKKVETSDVLRDLLLSPKTIDADGSSSVTISVQLNPDASPDKRNVVFTASGGTLTGGANGKVTIAAIYQNTSLVATTTLKTMTPGDITITATSETLSSNGDYQLKDGLTANLVIPATIKLEPSTFGIGAIFTTLDTITGTISSANKKKVSLNTKVDFNDFLDASLTIPAGGRFKMVQNASDTNSQVSAIYSAGSNVHTGDNIYISAKFSDYPNLQGSVLVLTINQ